jgi:ADP-heptose:LPS heptosyltransferase
MQLPVLEALKAFKPDAQVTLLGALPALDLLQDDPHWQAVESIQQWGLRHWGDKGDAHIRNAIETWLDRKKFDLILDASHAVHAVRDTIRRNGRKILDTGTDMPLDGVNGVDAIKKAVRAAWGLPVAHTVYPRLALDDDRLALADTALLASSTDRRIMIGISALASSRLKRWPIVHMAAVADMLAEKFNSQVVVFAGPQQAIADEMVALMKSSHKPIMVSTLHLLDTAALLARCELLICNDTGIMHMSAAVGTPVVAVFGPTSATIYLPPGAQHRAISSPEPCPYRKTQAFGPSRCLVLNRCLLDRNGCIDAVPLSAVLNSATQTLTGRLEGKRHATI